MPSICTLEQEPAIANTSHSITTNKTKISDLRIPPAAGTWRPSAEKPLARNSPAEQQLPDTATSHCWALLVLLAKQKGNWGRPSLPGQQGPCHSFGRACFKVTPKLTSAKKSNKPTQLGGEQMRMKYKQIIEGICKHQGGALKSLEALDEGGNNSATSSTTAPGGSSSVGFFAYRTVTFP